MPISPFIDFTRVPLQEKDYSALSNLPKNLLEGYYQPQQLKEEQRKRVLSNEEQQFKNALDKIYEEEKRQAEIKYLQNKATTEGFGPRLAEADIENKMAQAWAHRNPYGPADTETTIGAPSNIPESVIGRPFHTMPKNEQLYESKEMDKQLHKAQNMEATLPIIEKLKKIQRENPNLWKSYSLILADPDNREGVVSQFIKSNLVSEKEKTAIDLFSKYTGDLVLKGGEGLGGQQRITDSLRSLIRQVKPDVRNTPDANMAVLDGIRETMSAGPAMARAYRWGKKKRVSIIDNPEAFRNFKPGTAADNQEFAGQDEMLMQKNRGLLNQQSGQMVTIRNERTGETKQVSQAEAQAMGAL